MPRTNLFRIYAQTKSRLALSVKPWSFPLESHGCFSSMVLTQRSSLHYLPRKHAPCNMCSGSELVRAAINNWRRKAGNTEENWRPRLEGQCRDEQSDPNLVDHVGGVEACRGQITVQAATVDTWWFVKRSHPLSDQKLPLH